MIGRTALRFVAFIGVAAVACAAAPAASPPSTPIAYGVKVSGLPVGGFTSEPARARIREAFAQPLVFRFRGKEWRVSPERLGGAAAVDAAVSAALTATPGTDVAVPVRFGDRAIVRYARFLDRRYSREPERAKLVGLRNLAPVFSTPKPGWRIDRERAAAAIRAALRTATREPISLPARLVEPKITAANFGPVIVIRRESRVLHLYDGRRPIRTFRVAVGQPRYPTPLGTFTIVDKQRNPWWRPPPSDWAKGLKPVPPGPGNPLGTRWMGLDAFGVGIHATPDSSSIGYSASHGCIRMHMSEAEWLFDYVPHGTPVVIVSA